MFGYAFRVMQACRLIRANGRKSGAFAHFALDPETALMSFQYFGRDNRPSPNPSNRIAVLSTR
jgi:hypothetical protein